MARLSKLRAALRPIKQKLQGRTDAKIILVALFCSGGLSLSSLLSSRHPFEAELTVSALSFTSSQKQLFLHEIPNLQEITLTGTHQIALTGQFESPDLPELSQQTELTIDLGDQSAWTIIAPEDNPLILRSLHLGNNRIINLTHNAPTHRLYFTLQPNSVKTRKTEPATLQLQNPAAPVQLILEQVTFPTLKTSSSIPDTIELTYIPNTPLTVSLPHQGDFSVTLTPPSDPKMASLESRYWIWGDLQVKDVNLTEIITIGNDLNSTKTASTIIQGTARLADQNLDLKLGQYLLYESPGIQKLHDIQLDPTTSEFTVRLSGETNQLKSGISRDRPLTTLRSNWLTNFVSEKGAIAILTFSTGLFSALLSWVIANLITQPAEK
ncbi:MAG: hypothetical protein ACFCA4_10405 [Cyanophyceae cyanobacterium]